MSAKIDAVVMTPEEIGLADFLLAKGLMAPGDQVRCSPLTGGVSSDIWRVELPSLVVCVKRALAKLKVAADWQAPVNRNAFEWAWLSFAGHHCPDNVPKPLAHDEGAGLFAMEYLEPADHPVWKAELLNGNVVPETAAAVGDVLGRLHAASANRPDIESAFDSGSNFFALRLEPYLLATAERHPELAARLQSLAARTAATRKALVHGDVSPKNILVGPKGPIFLDAECAWYGDPAFDIGFCVNHLLLKAIVQPSKAAALRASFDAFCASYFSHVSWESPEILEKRAAELLPGLFLARSDGKSPVEYLTEEADRARLRSVATALLKRPPSRLAEVADAWYPVVTPS